MPPVSFESLLWINQSCDHDLFWQNSMQGMKNVLTMLAGTPPFCAAAGGALECTAGICQASEPRVVLLQAFRSFID